MSSEFRHAMCNEAFKGWDFRESCQILRKAGYTGIEIAPYTLADDPATVSQSQRHEYRHIMSGEGLAFVGLHWLMVSPEGLHVTTPDEAIRTRSWKHIHDLVDLCADLGPGGVLVFGSPKQRMSTGGLTRAEATRNFVTGLAEAAPHAEDRGVTILAEALPSEQCDVLQSLEEAVSVVNEIDSPAVQTMFDTHNAVEETEDHATLVKRYFPFIRHVHVNEMDGTHPGQRDYDFKPLLRVLRQRNYSGWVSLEVFDFTPGAEQIARESISFLRGETDRLPR